MREVVVHQAPAKVNVTLAVDRPRDDGMHPIRSWMITVDLCDELTITRLEPDRLSLYAVLWHPDARSRSEIDWSIRHDLAVRAHQRLEAHVGHALPVQMKLEKRIPVGAGLGGGSSDAAAMLRAVNELYRLDLSISALAEIGAELGSDVPFLVHGGSALAEGIGQRLTLLETLPEADLVLVMPSIRCETAAVYLAFDEAPHTVPPLDERRVEPCERIMPEGLFNDLLEPACRCYPALGDVHASLERLTQQRVHMTGSGSCCVVVCQDETHADALVSAIEDQLGHAAIAVRPMSVDA